MVTFRQWVKVNKEGMFIGATSGLIFTVYLASIGADLNFVMQQQSIVDNLIGSAMTLKDISLTKAGIIFMFLGTVIGGFIDSIYKPKK